MRTRDEHLAWCKRNALDYLDRGDVVGAVASMGNDLMKHPELEKVARVLMPLGMWIAMRRDAEEARRFIEGFR